MKRKTVLLTMLAILLVFPAILLSGCTAGEVVAPFNPKPVKPEPYNPEPPWDPRSDTTLTSIQSFKQQTGQTTAPSGSATGASGTTSGTSAGTPGSPGTPGAPIPIPTPPAPAPTGRVWSPSDSVYGRVIDRVEGGVIAGAVVTLMDKRSTTIDTYTTAGDGYYSFVNLAAGYYHLSTNANIAIPLSDYYFYYDGNPGKNITLEVLTVGTPEYQVLGGNFYASYGDVLAKYEYVASQQQTYWGALFETVQTEGVAYYRFLLPPTVPNGYDYDAQWSTTLQWAPDETTGVWASASQDKVNRYYYNWYNWAPIWPAGWYQTSDNGNVPFWAVKRETDGAGVAGEVRMATRSTATTQLLLTHVKHKYDYHKDHDGPPVISAVSVYPANNATSPYPTGSIDSLGTYFRLSENAYVTMSVYRGSDDFLIASQTMPWFNGIYNWQWQWLTPATLWVPGDYYYKLTAVDEAGHQSATYGPYWVTLDSPSVAVTKTANPASVPSGSATRFTITVTNTSLAPLFVDVSDALEYIDATHTVQLTSGSLTVNGVKIVPDPVISSGGAQTISLGDILVDYNSYVVIVFDATVTGESGAIVPNTVNVTDRLGGLYSASTSVGIPLMPPTSLTATLVPGPSVVPPSVYVDWTNPLPTSNIGQIRLERDTDSAFPSPVFYLITFPRFGGTVATTFTDNPGAGRFYYRARTENEFDVSDWSTVTAPLTVPPSVP